MFHTTDLCNSVLEMVLEENWSWLWLWEYCISNNVNKSEGEGYANSSWYWTQWHQTSEYSSLVKWLVYFSFPSQFSGPFLFNCRAVALLIPSCVCYIVATLSTCVSSRVNLLCITFFFSLKLSVSISNTKSLLFWKTRYNCSASEFGG